MTSKQEGETFLGEVVVVGQDFGDALLVHDSHRNTVGEAVFLVQPGFVKGEAREKG